MLVFTLSIDLIIQLKPVAIFLGHCQDITFFLEKGGHTVARKPCCIPGPWTAWQRELFLRCQSSVFPECGKQVLPHLFIGWVLEMSV
jgi:hypothetical protein